MPQNTQLKSRRARILIQGFLVPRSMLFLIFSPGPIARGRSWYYFFSLEPISGDIISLLYTGKDSLVHTQPHVGAQNELLEESPER